MSDILVSKAIGKLRSKKAVGGNQTRKALQVLQVSASDENLLISSPGMMRQKEKKTLEPAGDEEYGSKEHLLRRSKRRNIPSQNEDNEMQKQDNPAKTLKMKLPKASKAKKAPKDKKSKPAQLNQSNLDSYVSVASNEVVIPIKREMVSESSIFQDSSIDNTILTGERTIRVFRSTSDEANMLTSEVPDMTYWKMLAEQRQSALEIALNENDQLRDELEVLEVENSQLKNTLKELENVVQIIHDSL